ncbi:hypothetical protein LCGC14_0716520 [marine sediment metagenome]|uniref:Uncharacterized protein n=1 Tax=marine sediment metagenome TaxID=412755 RepID=A0A0F9QDJ3_9ZZZZ
MSSIFDGEHGSEDGVAIVKVDDDEETGKDKGKAEKAVSDLAAFKKAMSDAGIESADAKKVLASLEEKSKAAKAKKQEEDEEEEKKKAKAKAEDEAKGKGKGKAADDEEDDKGPPLFGKGKKAEKNTVFKMYDDGTVEVSGEVTKGRRMTAKRVEKIQQMFGEMAVLLKEADPEVFEKTIAAIAKGDLPRDPDRTDVEVQALELEGVRRAMAGKPPRKVVVVPNKIVNVVV